MSSKQTIVVAINLIALSAALLIVGFTISVKYGGVILGLALILYLLSVALLFWVSRNHRKHLLLYSLTIFITFFSSWVGVNFLDWISIYRHGDVGPGGGWSIAIGSIFLSLLLGTGLLVSASLAHIRSINGSPNASRLIPNNYYVLCLTWLSVILLLAFNIW